MMTQLELDKLQLTLPSKRLSEVASIVRDDWSAGNGISVGAKPYLTAMSTLDKVTDSYGADDGKMIVAYFLSNATAWRGPVARICKAHLKSLIK